VSCSQVYASQQQQWHSTNNLFVFSLHNKIWNNSGRASEYEDIYSKKKIVHSEVGEKARNSCRGLFNRPEISPLPYKYIFSL
jgi:hypothetical protein